MNRQVPVKVLASKQTQVLANGMLVVSSELEKIILQAFEAKLDLYVHGSYQKTIDGEKTLLSIEFSFTKNLNYHDV